MQDSIICLHPPELHLPGVFQPWYISRSLKTTALQRSVVNTTRNVPVAQLDRASDYGSEGREFESSRARKSPLPVSAGRGLFHFGQELRTHEGSSNEHAQRATNGGREATGVNRPGTLESPDGTRHRGFSILVQRDLNYRGREFDTSGRGDRDQARR